MFGLGSLPEIKAIKEMANRIPKRFSDQVDEILGDSGVFLEPSQCVAIMSYAFWCVHMAIMNSNISMKNQASLQRVLKVESINSVKNLLLQETIKMNVPKSNANAAFKLAMGLVQVGAEAYTEAFDRMQAKSYDISIQDDELFDYIFDIFCEGVSMRDPEVERALRQRREQIIPVMFKLLSECAVALR